jgi:hypothetical protein
VRGLLEPGARRQLGYYDTAGHLMDRGFQTAHSELLRIADRLQNPRLSMDETFALQEQWILAKFREDRVTSSYGQAPAAVMASEGIDWLVVGAPPREEEGSRLKARQALHGYLDRRVQEIGDRDPERAAALSQTLEATRREILGSPRQARGDAAKQIELSAWHIGEAARLFTRNDPSKNETPVSPITLVDHLRIPYEVGQQVIDAMEAVGGLGRHHESMYRSVNFTESQIPDLVKLLAPPTPFPTPTVAAQPTIPDDLKPSNSPNCVPADASCRYPAISFGGITRRLSRAPLALASCVNAATCFSSRSMALRQSVVAARRCALRSWLTPFNPRRAKCAAAARPGADRSQAWERVADRFPDPGSSGALTCGQGACTGRPGLGQSWSPTPAGDPLPGAPPRGAPLLWRPSNDSARD